MNSGGYQSAVLFRLSKIVVVVALTLSLGLHWTFLQSVAWVGMVVNYSQTAPLTEAVEKTFDGKHPCGLCKLVDEGKKSEKKQEAQKPPTKVDFFFVSNSVMLYAPVFDPLPALSYRFIATPGEAPATPPPRNLPG